MKKDELAEMKRWMDAEREERAAMRKNAERYLWHRARNPSSLLLTAWGASKAACEIGDDCDAATDAAMREADK